MLIGRLVAETVEFVLKKHITHPGPPLTIFQNPSST